MATTESYLLRSGVKRWRVRYTKPDGRGTDKRGFTTKRDADAWRAANAVAITSGTYVTPTASRTSMDELMDAYAARTTGLAAATVESRRYAIKNHVRPQWSGWQVGRITRGDVEAWIVSMEARGVGTQTIHKAHRALSSILKRAVEDQLIGKNHAAGAPLPKIGKKRNGYLTYEELSELAQAIDPRYKTLTVLMGLVGLRFGEAAALRVRSLQFDRNRVWIDEAVSEVGGKLSFGPVKTHELRAVAIPPLLVEPLRRQIEGKGREDLVFTAARGGPLSVTDWRNRTLYPALDRISAARQAAAERDGTTFHAFPGITPHDLRHTAASLAVASGASVKAVQDLLGHKDASMTLDTYTDLFDSDREAVARLMGERAAASSLGGIWDS